MAQHFTTGTLTLGMVAELLGTSRKELGYLSRYNINRWSRFKPVDFGGRLHAPTQAELRTLGLNYGFSVLTGNNPRQLMDGASYTREAWAYNPPRGGMNSLYRLDDFRGYDPEAHEPFAKVRTPTYAVWSQALTVTSGLLNPSPPASDLRPEDFDLFQGTFYFGAIVEQNGNYYFKTAATPSTQPVEVNLRLPTTINPYGTINLLPFFSAIPYPQGNETMQSGLCIAHPDGLRELPIYDRDPHPSKIVDFTAVITLGASDPGIKSFIVTIRNDSTEDINPLSVNATIDGSDGQAVSSVMFFGSYVIAAGTAETFRGAPILTDWYPSADRTYTAQVEFIYKRAGIQIQLDKTIHDIPVFAAPDIGDTETI